MDYKLLTQKDLAERWQVDISTITNWRNSGVLQQVKGIQAIRFNPQYIAELEGTKLERFSPIERRRMQEEIDMLKQKNSLLTEVLTNILSESSKVINISKL